MPVRGQSQWLRSCVYTRVREVPLKMGRHSFCQDFEGLIVCVVSLTLSETLDIHHYVQAINKIHKSWAYIAEGFGWHHSQKTLHSGLESLVLVG